MEEEHHNNIVHQHPIVALSQESQLLLSLLDKKSELPSYVDGTLNEAVNDIANEVLRKVRKSIVDILFVNKNDGPQRQERERGLAKTILDKDWHKTEKRIETAIRFFPGVVVEQRQGWYPIQWISMRMGGTNNYNLMSVSLIPLVIRLALEFRQLEEERGGVLSLYPSGINNTLQQIICYFNNNNEDNQLLDNCFSTVRNWMRGNYLVTEDIQRYNLFGYFFRKGIGFLSQSRLRYLLDMDPVTLSLPCYPECGNRLPIHWAAHHEDIRIFSLLLKAGMHNYPDKFGFAFCDGTHRNRNGTLFRGTPYELACDKHGQGTVTKLVIDSIQEYCFSSTTSTSDANDRETSLLMSAITDNSIHRDALYILLLWNDPIAALSKIQQQVLQLPLVEGDGQTIQQQVLPLVEGDGQTGTDTSTNSNDNNSNGATDTIVAILLLVIYILMLYIQ